MNNVNYDRLMAEIVTGLKDREKLLLHSCCAPCSTACIQRLKEHFDLTVYYYNPNMDSQEEFLLRRAEQEKYCQIENINVILEDYLSEQYHAVVQGLESQPEGGKRCQKCFNLRLEQTAKKAKEKGFSYFATTLTVSPLKNARLINQIGYELEKKYGVKYLPTDFKKQGGYLRSIQLSKQHNLYRQNYCGCEYSKSQQNNK